MTKEDNGDLKNSTKYCISHNEYVDFYFNVINPCLITGKYKSFGHRDCNIKHCLNYQILAVFHNLKNYDLHLIVQELGKFNFKITVSPDAIKKYVSFTISNKLSFIIIFQLISFSSERLVKKIDSNLLDLVKKGFHSYEYKAFDKFKIELLRKEKFYCFLTGKKLLRKKKKT